MKAAVITELGRPPRYADFETPPPAGGAVLARVEAASVKNIDRGLVSGRHYGSASLALPSVAGIDGVARLDDGRLVYASATAPYGMMAEQTLVDPTSAVELPAGVDAATGAALPNPGLSAWFSLEYAARVQPGHSVLLLGATGVTGAVAAQLAKSQFGAGRVVAAGRNRTRLDWLRSKGVDEVVAIDDDITDQVAALHASQPFDAVIDYLWGAPAEQVLAALGNSRLDARFHGTRYVQVGSMAGPAITLPAGVLRSAGIEILGSGAGSVPADGYARATTELLPALFGMVAEGSLSITTDSRPLADVEQVWAASEPSGTRMVLVP